jgi:hypothetical protein
LPSVASLSHRHRAIGCQTIPPSGYDAGSGVARYLPALFYRSARRRQVGTGLCLQFRNRRRWVGVR